MATYGNDGEILTESEILNIIHQELSQSAGGNENDFIDHNRKAALATYLGQPDGKEMEGKSSVTSTDVADAIEWIMPEVMKAFTQNNEVVTFDASNGNDELQAELESKFVYDQLMKKNNGFIIMHEFFKDALMQKNGFFKVSYAKHEKEEFHDFTGITEDQLAALVADDTLEITQMTENQEQFEGPEGTVIISTYDVRLTRTVEKGALQVLCVPPEEFRINKMHNSVDVSTARFSAHIFLQTAGDLIKEGYAKEFIDTIPTSQVYEDDREYRFYMQNETVYPDRDANADPSNRTLEVAECCMWMDLYRNGKPSYYKVTVAGGDNPDVLLDIEELNESPFISATAILMSHKLFGLSIYDRLKEIQAQKTTLWRNILDNMYLQNNQQKIVVENQVELDDVLVSRPGGIIRTKRLDSVAPFVTPPLSGDSYKMLDYLDHVRASRAGVSPDGSIQDTAMGDSVGSMGVDRIMNQKEELVGLMIRVFAETGIKPLCLKIRRDLIAHHDVISDYKFRGEWIQVNPSKWGERSEATVRVGTGSGNRKEQQVALSKCLEIQGIIKADPSQALVNENKIYSTIDDLLKASGLPGAERYFVDPNSPEGKSQRKITDEQNNKAKEEKSKQDAIVSEAQSKIAGAEETKAVAAAQAVQLKGELERTKNELKASEQHNKFQMDRLRAQLEEAQAMVKAKEAGDGLEHKYYQTDATTSVQREQIASTERIAGMNNESSGEEGSD